MTGYEAYVLYNSLKLHFTQESYDYTKYNGKSRTTVDSFEKRKDKYLFHKISKKYPSQDDLAQFYIANFIEEPSVWIGKLLDEESDGVYKNQQKVLQSLSYIFEDDCRNLFEEVDNPNEILKTDGNYPILLIRTLQKQIHFETLCILNKILNFVPMWSKRIQDDIKWPEYKKKIEKFSCFLPSDMVKYKLILKKVLKS